MKRSEIEYGVFYDRFEHYFYICKFYSFQHAYYATYSVIISSHCGYTYRSQILSIKFKEAIPGLLGIQGEGLLFSGIWGESITSWGFREQRAEEKHFKELGRKIIFLSGSREQRPPLGASLKVLVSEYIKLVQITTISKYHLSLKNGSDKNNFKISYFLLKSSLISPLVRKKRDIFEIKK